MLLTVTAIVAGLLLPVVQSQTFTIQAENSINVTVGGTANFTVKPSRSVKNGNWDFNGKSIGLWIGSSVSLSNEYKPRAEIRTPNGSLELKSVTVSDSGKYTVTMVPEEGEQASATITLHVIEPVNNVTISSNNSAPVESLHTILLTCRAMGSVQSRIWYKDNKVVKNNDRMMTSEDNTTLTIINVDRNDSGIYTCYVFSSINNDSRGFNLIINYGPDEVIIRPPGSNQLEPGASLTLSCSASSVPPAIYKWYNGDNLLHMGQTYNIDSTSQGSDGNYTCQAHNTITNKNRSSTVEVTIQEKGTQSNKLSAGAIVGILIGVLAAVLVTGLAVWQNKKKHCRRNGGCQQNNSIMTSPGSGAAASSNGTNPENMTSGTDIVYAQPNINPLHQGPTAPPAPTDGNKTDYAELKFR